MIEPYDVDSNRDDPEVMIAEWIWSQAPISCPWAKESKNTYDFDVKRDDRTFDLLLEKKQLRLPANHGSLRLKNLKGRNTTSSTMLPTTTPMIIESSASTFRRPLSKERSSWSQPRNQQ
jgi:hypothetical protein